MISSTSTDPIREALVPPKLKASYTNFELTSETSYYKSYNATYTKTGERHTIRVLDTNSAFFKKDYNASITLFLQELFRLCLRITQPEAVYLQCFEFFRGNIGFVMKPCNNIGNKDAEGQARPKYDINKMLKDIISDINFMRGEMKFTNINLESKSIFHSKFSNVFFVGDWAASAGDVTTEQSTQNQKDAATSKTTSAIGKTLLKKNQSDGREQSFLTSNDTYSLGLLILETGGIKRREMEALSAIEDEYTYNVYLEGLLKKLEGTNQKESLNKLLQGLLQRDAGTKGKIDELMLSTFDYGTENYTLKAAWCYSKSNLVSLYDMQISQQFDGYQGTQLKTEGGYITLVEQVPNTNYLLSCVSRDNEVSNFGLFDFTKELTDITTNSKRGFSALLSIKNSVSYHLLDSNSLEVTKKAKWQTCHKGLINSLDFDPEGKRIAMFDVGGVCSVTEVDGNCTEHFNVKVTNKKSISYNRCRWNPAFPIIAVKFDDKSLNMIDAEKHTSMYRFDLTLDALASTLWIDWHRDGNLLACSGYQSVKLYDRREGNVIKTFENLHSDWIYSVRWSPTGGFLATASEDKTVKILDSGTSRILFSAESVDGNWPSSICFLRTNHKN